MKTKSDWEKLPAKVRSGALMRLLSAAIEADEEFRIYAGIGTDNAKKMCDRAYDRAESYRAMYQVLSKLG